MSITSLKIFLLAFVIVCIIYDVMIVHIFIDDFIIIRANSLPIMINQIHLVLIEMLLSISSLNHSFIRISWWVFPCRAN